MSYGPSRSTNHQRSRTIGAAEHRYAAKATRRGDAEGGRAAEPAAATPMATTWPELVIVTGATPIANMAGRYTGSRFGVSVSPAGTGDLTLAQLGASYGACEILNPADVGALSHGLFTTDVCLAFRAPWGTVRDKELYVVAGGGQAMSYWLKPTAKTLASPGIWSYTGEVWRGPGVGALVASGVPMRNAFEVGNTTSNRAGWTIATSGTACKDIIDIYPTPLDHFYRMGGRHRLTDGTVACFFEFANDPKPRGM